MAPAVPSDIPEGNDRFACAAERVVWRLYD